MCGCLVALTYIKLNQYPPWNWHFSHLKIDGWKRILSFWGPTYFQALLLLVSGRVYVYIYIYMHYTGCLIGILISWFNNIIPTYLGSIINPHKKNHQQPTSFRVFGISGGTTFFCCPKKNGSSGRPWMIKGPGPWLPPRIRFLGGFVVLKFVGKNKPNQQVFHQRDGQKNPMKNS